jgi:hypothetical protein
MEKKLEQNKLQQNIEKNTVYFNKPENEPQP